MTSPQPLDPAMKQYDWFHGLLPREEVKLLLVKNGDFLLRSSEPSFGQTRHIILSVVHNQDDPAHEGVHYVIRTDSSRYSILENQSFGTILELVNHHRVHRLNAALPTSVLINAICRQPWELTHDQVSATKVLGEGAFGEVRLGKLSMNGATLDVAVKVAKLEKCTKEQIKEIMTEARVMRKFDHRNVVRCYGVAALDEPLMVVMELAQGGGLDGYLKKNQVGMQEKLDIIHQVSAGLSYIHKMNIMHRDIASRNVLYGNQVAKVSDFGLSRVGTVYQSDPNKKAPIRWLSPETMNTSVYTHATDVFAFGVLCWEVIENAQEPYPHMTVAEVHQKVLRDDYRMSVRTDAPPVLHEIIRKCWVREGPARPRMEEVYHMTLPFITGKKTIEASPDRARIIPAKVLSGARSKDKTGRRKLTPQPRRPSTAGFGKGGGPLSGSQRDEVAGAPAVAVSPAKEKADSKDDKKSKGGHRHKKK